METTVAIGMAVRVKSVQALSRRISQIASKIVLPVAFLNSSVAIRFEHFISVATYVFMIRYLRSSRHFRKIVKMLCDNFRTLTLRMHSLLAGLRELYGAKTSSDPPKRWRKRKVPH